MRILVLQLKRIGDLILTTPALSLLEERFPGSEIRVLTSRGCAGIAPALPASSVIANGSPGFWKSAIAGGYDACLDFTGTDRSALLAALSRAPRRIAYARFKKRWPRHLAWNEFVDSPVKDRHTAEHHTDLLAPLGAKETDRPLDLRVPGESVGRARQLLENTGVSDPYAVLHPGTARPEKYWLADRWASVANTLIRLGIRPVLTGSTDPGETAHIRQIRAACPDAIDLAGKTNLLELAATIAGARVFCGVDTAAMHLADAMRVPTLALFGPTNPFHWMPRHTRHIVLRSRTEEPFSFSQKGGAMDAISSRQAIEALQQILSSQSFSCD